MRQTSPNLYAGLRQTLWIPALVAGILGLLAPCVSAHDMWIVPPREPVEAGELLAVELRVGHAGDTEPVRRNDQRIVRFFAAGPDPTEKTLDVLGLAGSHPAGYLRPAQEGLWSLGYVSQPAYSELQAEAFNRYLTEEGLQTILNQRRESKQLGSPGTELYSRSLKSLIWVGKVNEEHSSIGDRRLGLPLEMVIEPVNTSLFGIHSAAGNRTTQPWTVRLWYQDQPLSNVAVRIFRLDNPEQQSVQVHTDQEGRFQFIPTPGRWRLATVHMLPSTDESNTEVSKTAEWRSFFSTLTFTVPTTNPELRAHLLFTNDFPPPLQLDIVTHKVTLIPDAITTREASDAQLLQAIGQGDQQAFRAFYDRHSGKVLTTLRQLCADSTAAEDVLQETFLAVWRKAATYRKERGDVPGWLYTVTRNKMFDYYRRKRPTLFLDEQVHQPLVPPEAPTSELRISLEKALKGLKTGEVEALRMAYFGGFTYEESAQRLQVPLGTFKSRIRTGLRKMQKKLKEFSGGG